MRSAGPRPEQSASMNLLNPRELVRMSRSLQPGQIARAVFVLISSSLLGVTSLIFQLPRPNDGRVHGLFSLPGCSSSAAHEQQRLVNWGFSVLLALPESRTGPSISEIRKSRELTRLSVCA